MATHNTHLRMRAQQAFKSAAVRALHILAEKGEEIEKQLINSKYPPPAPENMPPHKRSGWLRDNIDHEVDETRMVGRIGANVNYLRFLELGFHDRNGKFHGPWPSLRPMLRKLERKVVPELKKQYAKLPKG